jgi:hypothetical protein
VETLVEALLRHAARHEVAKAEATPFGTRYVVEGGLEAPDGRAPLVRVVWFVETGEEGSNGTSTPPRRVLYSPRNFSPLRGVFRPRRSEVS